MPYKLWKEAATRMTALDGGAWFIDLQPGNGTRYPIVVSAVKIPDYHGTQVTLMWHFHGWRSYVFNSKPDIAYLAEKWNLDAKEYKGDLEAVLYYWDEIVNLVE